MIRIAGLACLVTMSVAVAQNLPVIGTMAADTVITGSGRSFLVVPGIDDGDAGVTQPVSVTAVSSNTNVLSIDSVSYVSGARTAVVHVAEKGVDGTVTVTVTVTDPDGPRQGTKTVVVGPPNNPGIKFEIHDIIFWQQAVPLTSTPVYSRVLQTARIQTADLNFAEIPITVNLDCVTRPPCTGYDFYTQMYRGYLRAPTTGSYTFYMEGGDAKGLWLSTSDTLSRAVAIVNSASARPLVGTDIGGGQWRSAPQSLVAGKVYAIYATHYVIHNHPSGILWEGPGITKTYIPGTHLMPTYDFKRPGSPRNTAITAAGTNYLRVVWSKSTVTTPAAVAYLVYVNGTLHSTVTDTTAVLTGLAPGATHSVFVVARSQTGMKSFPGAVVTRATYGTDTNPPTAPTTVSPLTVSDLAIELQWSGATDAESEVAAFNVFVNDVKYNATPWYANSIILRNLVPGTGYRLEVQAIDGGGNVSPKSTVQTVTTLAFNWSNPELGVKKASVSFTGTAIANACGLGINANYLDGTIYNTATRALLNELRPNLLRWGALDANPLNFSAYSGTGKTSTYARFLDLCNQVGAYCSITTGVKDGTDWRTNIQTFVNFIEYLNGPSSTTHGARRAAEGFTAPLMANSKGLLIELGNEVWGAAAHNAEIGANYATYGDWCRQVADAMKASPYWDSSKMWVVYSGRNPHPQDSYGLNFNMVMKDSGEVEMMSVGGYLGGNLNYDPAIAPGMSEGSYYKDGFKRLQRNIDGLDITISWMATNIHQYKPTYFYESNMTTTSYNGRLGQAVTMIDYMATAIEHGSVLPTVFHLTGGEWKLVRTTDNNFKLPLFHGSAFYNRLCQGWALGSSIQTQGRLVDAVGATLTMNPVGFHLYNNGSNFTVLLTSRDFDNDYTVQLNLPGAINPSSSAKRIVLSGTDFSTVNTVIDSSNITLTNGMLVSVPRHSMVFITFTGTAVNADLPLGYFAGTTAIDNGRGLETPRLRPVQRSDIPCEIYDLRGRRISVVREHELRGITLPAGTYIVRQANDVRKVSERNMVK